MGAMPSLLPLLTWLAFPVYVWQGLTVRRRIVRMLPAQGPVIHHIEGTGEPINLLVLGDSSAASVGVESSERGLAARIAHRAHEATGRPVVWRAAGFNSATAGRLRDHVVPNIDPGHWTHLVLTVGSNDAKNFHTGARFNREFGTLLYALRAKWPEARVVWSPVVEMSLMPALPPALGRILEIRAGLINYWGHRLCLERGAVPATRLPIDDPIAGFSLDGFHASEAGYDRWAEHLLPLLLDTRITEA